MPEHKFQQDQSYLTNLYYPPLRPFSGFPIRMIFAQVSTLLHQFLLRSDCHHRLYQRHQMPLEILRITSDATLSLVNWKKKSPKRAENYERKGAIENNLLQIAKQPLEFIIEVYLKPHTFR